MSIVLRIGILLILLWLMWDMARQLGYGWEQVPATIVATTPPERFSLADDVTAQELRSKEYAPNWLRHRIQPDGIEASSLPEHLYAEHLDDLGFNQEYQRRYPLGSSVMVWRHPQLAPNGVIERASLLGIITWRLAFIGIFLGILILPQWLIRRAGLSAIICSGIGLAFLLVGLVLSTFIIAPLWRIIDVATWKEVPAQVKSIQQGTYSVKKVQHWKGEIIYEYQWENNTYTANRVDPDHIHSEDWETIVSHMQVGQTTVAYINPDQPWRSVLRNRLYEPTIF